MERDMEVFKNNYDDFRFEINRLIKRFGFSFDRTYVHVFLYKIRHVEYLFFIIEEFSFYSDDEEGRMSMLYPLDFKYGNYTNCTYVDLEDINSDKAVEILECNGYEFNIIVQHQDILDDLTAQLSSRKLEKFKITSSHLISKVCNQRTDKLSRLNNEITVIEQYISDIHEGVF